ncbi:hypothetical protein [Pseudofrankia sp. BMG5.37]|uniref:hypothetical protein n=1 Tax=Pseudofrankia sp. BMG5.37 TaxID=3050035 RepID=UPI0028956F31|nr:hypothetical protein [Pseudofrankia sp. BMG5.37]MDT3438013.1 hypothetical protein [Pseudofrankia sp. BMG5.37]
MTAASVATGPDGVGADERTAGTRATGDLAGEALPRGHHPRRRLAAWRPGAGRRHWLFAVFLVAGTGLRLLAMYAYRPAFEFSGDSYAYLTLARLHQPDPMRPAGYPVLLSVLAHTHRLAVVPAVQHAAGLAIGLALYAFLLRRGIGPVGSALAAAPVLLDAYQLDIEHFVMAETLFLALLVGALMALLWSPRPSIAACALAGGLLAAAGLTRTLGVALGVLALAYVFVRRLGWLRLAAFAVVFAAPLAGYATWYHSYHGTYALSGGDDAWLYGRVAPIADCGRLRLSPEQLVLCSPYPPADRPGPNYYVWADTSPRFQLTGTDEHKNQVLGGFAHEVIRRQPADYARMVAAEVGHYFAPGHYTGYRDWPDGAWRFPDAHTPRYFHVSEPLLDFDERHPPRVVHEWAAGLLRGYQHFAYTPGPLLAVLVVLALIATGLGLPRPRLPGRPRHGQADGVLGPPGGDTTAGETTGSADPAGTSGTAGANETGVGAAVAGGDAPAWRRLLERARRRPARPGVDPVTDERRRIGADCALLTALGLAVLVVPAATVCFDYRYILPVLVLFPPAAALAVRQFHLAPHR